MLTALILSAGFVIYSLLFGYSHAKMKQYFARRCPYCRQQKKLCNWEGRRHEQYLPWVVFWPFGYLCLAGYWILVKPVVWSFLVMAKAGHNAVEIPPKQEITTVARGTAVELYGQRVPWGDPEEWRWK